MKHHFSHYFCLLLKNPPFFWSRCIHNIFMWLCNKAERLNFLVCYRLFDQNCDFLTEKSEFFKKITSNWMCDVFSSVITSFGDPDWYQNERKISTVCLQVNFCASRHSFLNKDLPHVGKSAAILWLWRGNKVWHKEPFVLQGTPQF